MYTAFKAIAQGDSHKEKNLPCQDAALASAVSNWGVAIVADGHGSEKHFRSDAGSQTAVKTALYAITDFIKLQGKEKKTIHDAACMDEQLRQLERYIIVTWRKNVLVSFDENPLTEEETAFCAERGVDPENENDRVRLYGTTLIAALVYKKGWFVLQIGDGRCVCLDPEGLPFFPPELEDESLEGGKTTSLCDSDAAGHFRHAFGYETIRGITVASDGVSDSFIPEDYLKLHRRLLDDFSADSKRAAEGLQKSISVWSSKGSRDDVSMAGVFYKPDLLGSIFGRRKS
ncbi:MAG: protein phosphatase 2C domain-containing protein [Spirochaetaceae bacterium]|jgi:serine/threonine protein phosphatase PrpC|nr:protein phosphatase 2C domain-containing protein [Spirochaetaceae bacterium]